jgi:V-type H+-transporting ATPase subunit e
VVLSLLLLVSTVEALSPPQPVSNGTALFIGTFGVIILWMYVLSLAGRISKDMFYISVVIFCTLGVSTWLLWLCAWMHQWHPLIVPQYKLEHSEQ